MSYIPWCTYVPNFKFLEAPKPTAAATKAPLTTGVPNVASPSAIPSAPPIDAMPPSYDDVMKQIADAKTEVYTYKSLNSVNNCCGYRNRHKLDNTKHEVYSTAYG